MVPLPEQQARSNIDALLKAAGWHVCDVSNSNIHAARGVAIREFPLPGYGFADYLLYIDGKAAGVIEAKKEGVTLTGVESQSDKYTKGLPSGLPRWSNPLPFAYQSTGVETRFTNGLDPNPRSRPVFAFHKPDLLAEWLAYSKASDLAEKEAAQPSATFLAKLQSMPPLKEEGLWPAQVQAIQNLEHSLKENRPRALIQMATGSGKTFTAISFMIRPSITGRGRQESSDWAANWAQVCRAAKSRGRIRPAKRCSTLPSQAVSFWLRRGSVARSLRMLFSISPRVMTLRWRLVSSCSSSQVMTCGAGDFLRYSERTQVSGNQLMARRCGRCPGCGRNPGLRRRGRAAAARRRRVCLGAGG